jgi:FAD:protein FMN transferase
MIWSRGRSTRLASRLRLSLGLDGLAAAAAFAAVVAAVGGVVAPRQPDSFRVSRARYEMGTVLEIEAVGPDRAATERGLAAAFHAVEEVERRLSNWSEESELSRANASAATGSVTLSPATWRSLSVAIALARETDGAFDPTVGAVTGAFGLTGHPPDRARPEAVGWEKARLDPQTRTLAFAVPGGAIDSGGFGKGEALDRALVEVRRGGLTAARLNFGGQISLWGSRTRGGGRDFGEVSIAEPRAGSERELCRFVPGDGSVSTSAASERPGHIIDPRTGTAAPYTGSVTVVADSGVRADALSTALFVLGPRAGLDLANRRGIAALFVVPRVAGGWDLVPSRRFPRFRITRVGP